MKTKSPTKKEKYDLKKKQKEAKRTRQARKNTLNKIVFWGVVVFVLAGSAAALISVVGNSDRYPVPDLDGITETDQTKGNENADVVLVEYSDFECPACETYYPIIKELVDEFGDEMLFVYRHFPLSTIHANAEPAARVSEAAGRQGMFWEMHDLIFEFQHEWRENRGAEEFFFSLAEGLELDMERFEEDYNSSEIRRKVSADYGSGLRAGVQGTPTFFLNGARIQNPRNHQEFREIIKAEIDAQNERRNEQ